MFAYIIRRILQLIPVIFGISIITFTLSFIVPGDPVRSIMGQRSDREAELRIRQKFGLDKPWYMQYMIWVRNLVRNPGELPKCKLRTDPVSGGQVYQLSFNPDMIFASDGEIRAVTNLPYRRNILTHLIEPGVEYSGETPSHGGSQYTVSNITDSPEGKKITLKGLLGGIEEFDVSPDIKVIAASGTSGLEKIQDGVNYYGYFDPEGFQSGRNFNAIMDISSREVIDGLYDTASADTREVSQLGSAYPATVTGIEKRGQVWWIGLKDEDGESATHELMMNALLMFGGNRETIDAVSVGDEVMAAMVNRKETYLYAFYDDESKDLPEIVEAIDSHADKTFVSGTLADAIITPSVWGDFGTSYVQRREVREIIRGSFMNTLYLSTVAMLIAIVIGIGAGIVSAVKPYSAIDYITMTGALIGVSMPVFWLGIMLILLFQGQLGWISETGYGAVKWYAVNLGLFSLKFPWHEQIILPAVTLSTVPMAIIARMTRSSMLEVMNLDYIRTARAKGLNEWTVIIRHALKNSLIPIITVIGVDFALLLAGAVLTETVFSWPGLGREIVNAIEARDFPVVMAGVVLFAIVFVIVNLIVDILYAYIDPRIRYQ